jgi:hypothetical protein
MKIEQGEGEILVTRPTERGEDARSTASRAR